MLSQCMCCVGQDTQADVVVDPGQVSAATGLHIKEDATGEEEFYQDTDGSPVDTVVRPEVGISLRVIPGQDLSSSQAAEDGIPVMVELLPPEGTSRTPSDFCCVVDISGSMGAEALLQSETGEMAGHGLSVLDVVKHALKTIIKNLDLSKDRFALIAYSNAAEKVLGLTEDPTSTANMAKVDAMKPSGQTNLWAGVLKGLEELKDFGQAGRLQHVMLFTDGLPNLNPPRGILPMLKTFKEKNRKNFFAGRLPTINTFGFGYELDSELLSQLAITGSGAYAFIPDAGFVGTVFVNAMTNLMVTMAKDVELKLEAQNGAKIKEIYGGHPVDEGATATSSILTLGTVRFGQPLRVVTKMVVPAAAARNGYLKATVRYAHRDLKKNEGFAARTCMASCSVTPELKVVAIEALRLQVVDGLRVCMQLLKLTAADKAQEKQLPLADAMRVVSGLIKQLDAAPDLKEDLTGQVSEALSRPEWYRRWGVHYLPSLMFAHLTQQCNNFKDAGVQTYGGDLFKQLREGADKIFVEMPPPTPTAVTTPVVQNGPPGQATASSRIAVAPISAPPVSMSAFYNSGGG